MPIENQDIFDKDRNIDSPNVKCKRELSLVDLFFKRKEKLDSGTTR